MLRRIIRLYIPKEKSKQKISTRKKTKSKRKIHFIKKENDLSNILKTFLNYFFTSLFLNSAIPHQQPISTPQSPRSGLSVASLFVYTPQIRLSARFSPVYNNLQFLIKSC